MSKLIIQIPCLNEAATLPATLRDPPPGQEDGTAPLRFGRAPLYPLFPAAVPGWTGSMPRATETPRPVKIAQAAVGAAGVWLIGLIAARAAGRRAGAAAALLAAVYPPLVWICAYALSEVLYSVLALASVLLLSRATGASHPQTTPLRGDVWWAVVAGLVAGLATLTRPTMLFFVLLAGVWLVTRRKGTLAVALIGGALLAIGPWTVRNTLVHGRVVVVSSQGGVTFWTGNHPLARGEGDMAANPDIKLANLRLRQQHPGLDAEALEPIYYRESLSYIAEHPLWWAGLLARKLFYLIVPVGPSYTLHSARYFAASIVSYGVILPFAVVGFLRLRREPDPPRVLWLLAGAAVASCLVFFPQERFRIPVLDPTLIVCAAATRIR